MHKSNIHAALTIAAIISTLKTAPSYAFTLADTSVMFGNAWLTDGTTVDRVAISDAPMFVHLIHLGDYTDEPEQVIESGVLNGLDAMDIDMYEVHHQ
ncbi:hypothetical protein IQ260_12830 [Leptolyngbya cf. ectocarpi LEGE 11479]|uniref:Uncharacterized protein n=1 Tax=Leptolyngbya cf. ectocarpi LEGE 11479 TaxID=1828722 RepID=A0A928ZU86_LEPEC|nr:hypothetical protein [Leptolyngbya ectocarpi]MBE9067544.1 hypothetical protein [Leptolyngbya cf. ectocarpi LEGE 11479]